MAKITVQLVQDEESAWVVAQVVEYPGVISQGRTIQQALKRVGKALRLAIESDVLNAPTEEEEVRWRAMSRKGEK